jgi:hypothetical protein
MNKIFINVAAYRDPELIPTIEDAIKKAKDKSRLSFGICWQYGKDESENLGEKKNSLFDGVKLRYIRIPAEESYGMNWARKLAHGFWTEDCNYYLQIDSHMRFVKNWDFELLKMISQCDSKKPVLTQRCYPYYPENNEVKSTTGTTYMHAKKFRENGVLVLSAGQVSKKEKVKKPISVAFISGHFMFAKSKLIQEMPYDNDIAVIATGDEPLLGMKAWTRGWDIFTPHKPVMYHHFYREKHPKFHSDHKKDQEIPWTKIEKLGVERSNQINFKSYVGKYGLGKERSLKEFGEYAGVDFKNKKVTSESRPKGVFKDKTKEIKRLKGKSPKGKLEIVNNREGKDKIYVQIASYRDPDVESTINDLLKKANKPDNLIVGVCDQYGPENKHLTVYDQESFRVMRVPFYVSKGLGWARAMIQTMYFDGDAEYTMQLDSHMRFVKDWDKKLIQMMKDSGSTKPIISHYCPGFSSKDSAGDKFLDKKGILKMYCLRFNDTGTVSFRATHASKEEQESGKPIPSVLMSGHFYFTLAKHIREFKYDPNLYFAGDEVTLATRSWTKGWDMFAPSEPVVFHNYTREERICHWSDQKTNYGQLHEESLKKVRQMLHREDNNLDIGEYGLGDVRSLSDFEKASGIDFKNRALSERAKNGDPDVSKYVKG